MKLMYYLKCIIFIHSLDKKRPPLAKFRPPLTKNDPRGSQHFKIMVITQKTPTPFGVGVFCSNRPSATDQLFLSSTVMTTLPTFSLR